MSADEIVDVVSLEDEVVGRATRSEVRESNLLHRTVAILCTNSTDELYVHRRTDTKDIYPGMYDVFAGGVVSAGEGYDEAARRELAEELGIAGPELSFLFRYLFLGHQERCWMAVYEVTWDGEIHHQESEVAWGQFMPLEEVLRRVGEWPVPPDSRDLLARWLELRG
jgi:8-oxo-dGTP pyrophosphatase MutT (NUDIX family)